MNPQALELLQHPKAFEDSGTKHRYCLRELLLSLRSWHDSALQVLQTGYRSVWTGRYCGALRRSTHNSGQLFRDIFTNRNRLWSFSFRFADLLRESGSGRSSKEDFSTLLAKLQSSKIASVPTTFNVTVSNGIQKNSRFNSRVMSLDTCAEAEVQEAYDREDEDGNSLLIKGERSDFDIQDHEAVAGKEYDATDKETEYPILSENQVIKDLEDRNDKYSQKSVETTQSGYVSDPGISKADLWTCSKFKRHFSNLEKFDEHGKKTHHSPALKSKPSENFVDLSEMSPRSVMSHYSADSVMLKRHSSSQVLPSGRKKLWWKMILWSHRSITFPSNSTLPASAALNSGYSSDTLEPKHGKTLRPAKSSGSITTESFNKSRTGKNIDNQRGSRFQSDQWIAFSTESSSFARVDAWVKSLEIQQLLPEDDFDVDNARSIAFPPSPDTGGTMMRATSKLTYPDANVSKETLTAINVVKSLNPASTIAHICGIGVKAIPGISHLSNLRSVNLSNNFIVHISPGFLPKGIQTLNLSRNKISTLDGLRELTKLRVLDLSYNRISRIGQGLSSCTLVKELYLVGNKISDAEGLHRLLKLTVLDLSFNKITTTKALGQLVANYNSLKALNLLGNPIQKNISHDQLSKAVSGLLPKLVYLNKQPFKDHRTREILSNSVARAALGNSTRSCDKRSIRRLGHGGSSFSKGYRRSASVSHKNMNGTRR
ncbi:unnamed protein product [Sphenostylis stenocarpa]|uniref:Uncharacterized protein n=1 Tax=Sphenostylis stenocarpa TaxID=92480 RepID=A0AA86T4X2_9FABA|nr:unnamed protein product [Sphenostylis stenocarpa]